MLHDYSRCFILLISLLLQIITKNFIIANDSFCGNITIHTQKYFSNLTSKLIEKKSSDNLKDCIDYCCSLDDCNSVTFSGIFHSSTTSKEDDNKNCHLHFCSLNDCLVVDAPELSTGVVSIIIKRNTLHINPSSPVNNISNNNIASFPTPNAIQILPDNNVKSTTPTMNSAIFIRPTNSDEALVPVWIIGLSVIILIVCLGGNLTIFVSYFCYRRSRRLRHTAEITTIKTPTLHAFNGPI